MDVTYWSGFLPAGAPEEIADILDGAVAKVMIDKKTTDRLTSLGLDPADIPSAKMKAFVQSELDKWGRLIHQAGIEPN